MLQREGRETWSESRDTIICADARLSACTDGWGAPIGKKESLSVRLLLGEGVSIPFLPV